MDSAQHSTTKPPELPVPESSEPTTMDHPDDDRDYQLERKHFVEVLRAFNDYGPLLFSDIARRRSHLMKLPESQKKRLPGGFAGMNKKLKTYTSLVFKNAEFLSFITSNYNYYHEKFRTTEEERACVFLEELYKRRKGSGGDRRRAFQCLSLNRHMSKVKSILHQCVRDWSDEGKEERDQCYAPLISALEKYLPVNELNRNKLSVVIPGAGLGRLVVELAARGYVAQGNDFDYFMLLCSSFMMNRAELRHQFSIFPWLERRCNVFHHRDPMQEIRIPDVCAYDLLAENPNPHLCMCAGEFVEVYKSQKEEHEGIATCFFIDTAPNIIKYVEVIYNMLKPGGIWTSIGPLMYHWADGSVHDDERYGQSIELSFDELRHVIKTFGFEFLTEERRTCKYAAHTESMTSTVYNAVLFTVRKPKAGAADVEISSKDT